MSTRTFKSKYGTHEVLVDDEDEALLTQSGWTAHRSKRTFYCCRQVRGTTAIERLHRTIMQAKPGEIVDHINGNGLDNRRTNLRITDLAGNAQNAVRPLGVSGLRGVAFFPGRAKPFHVRIRCRGRRVQFGYFASAEEAKAARDAAVAVLHGQYAVI